MRTPPRARQRAASASAAQGLDFSCEHLAARRPFRLLRSLAFDDVRGRARSEALARESGAELRELLLELLQLRAELAALFLDVHDSRQRRDQLGTPAEH